MCKEHSKSLAQGRPGTTALAPGVPQKDPFGASERGVPESVWGLLPVGQAWDTTKPVGNATNSARSFGLEACMNDAQSESISFSSPTFNNREVSDKAGYAARATRSELSAPECAGMGESEPSGPPPSACDPAASHNTRSRSGSHSTAPPRSPLSDDCPPGQGPADVHHRRQRSFYDEAMPKKWQKRDKAKHLEGERSRRQKRNNKLDNLRSLLEMAGNAPLNTVLSEAILEVTKRAKQAASARKKAAGGGGGRKPKAEGVDPVLHREMFHLLDGPVGALLVDSAQRVVETNTEMGSILGLAAPQPLSGVQQGLMEGSRDLAGLPLSSVMDGSDYPRFARMLAVTRSEVSRPRKPGARRRREGGGDFKGLSTHAILNCCSDPIGVEVAVTTGSTLIMVPSFLPTPPSSPLGAAPAPLLAPPSPNLQEPVCLQYMSEGTEELAGVGGGRSLLEGAFLLTESINLPELMTLLGCAAHHHNTYTWEACQACWPGEQWERFGASDCTLLEVHLTVALSEDRQQLQRVESAITDEDPIPMSLRTDSFTLDGSPVSATAESGDKATVTTTLLNDTCVQQWYMWGSAMGTVYMSKRWDASEEGLTCDISVSCGNQKLNGVRLFYRRIA